MQFDATPNSLFYGHLCCISTAFILVSCFKVSYLKDSVDERSQPNITTLKQRSKTFMKFAIPGFWKQLPHGELA